MKLKLGNNEVHIFCLCWLLSRIYCAVTEVNRFRKRKIAAVAYKSDADYAQIGLAPETSEEVSHNFFSITRAFIKGI